MARIGPGGERYVPDSSDTTDSGESDNSDTNDGDGSPGGSPGPSRTPSGTFDGGGSSGGGSSGGSSGGGSPGGSPGPSRTPLGTIGGGSGGGGSSSGSNSTNDSNGGGGTAESDPRPPGMKDSDSESPSTGGSDGPVTPRNQGPLEATEQQKERAKNIKETAGKVIDATDRYQQDKDTGLVTPRNQDPLEATKQQKERARLSKEEAKTLTEATASGGVFSEKTEQTIRDKTQQAADALNFEKGVEETLNPVVGKQIGGFLGGVGALPGGAVQAGGSAVNLGESAIETGQSIKSGEVKAKDVGEAVVGAGGETAKATASEISSDPWSAAGEIVGGFAIGSAAVKGLEKAGSGLRSFQIARQSDSTVDLSDITDDTGMAGELPKFDTDTDAPTSRAVDEVSERARNNPEGIKPAESEGAIFHTTQQNLPGDLDVAEGASELPGMFGSPEASPIGLTISKGKSVLSDLKPRKPRLRGESDRVVSLPGDDVRGMPGRAQGAGYELRTPKGDIKTRGLSRGEAKAAAEGTDLEVKPQSDTGGYQFLTEEADPGAAFVRPTGSRTSELEAIYPPGSQFAKEGTTAVRIGGRTFPFTDTRIPGTGRVVPGERYKGVDAPDVDADYVATTRPDAPDGGTDISDIPSSQISSRSGTPVGPPFGGLPGTTPTPDGPETTPQPSDPYGTIESSIFDGISDSAGPSGVSSPGGGSPTGTPPSSPPSSPPTSPPSGTPTSPPGSSGGGGSGSSPPGDSPTSPLGSPTGSSFSPSPSGGSGGGSSPIYPFGPAPTGSGKSPWDLPEFDSPDNVPPAGEIEGGRKDVFTGFRNPLTGERL